MYQLKDRDCHSRKTLKKKNKNLKKFKNYVVYQTHFKC